MGGTRAIWHRGWKAAAISPSPPTCGPAYATQRWELFNTDEDPSECHDLADEQPEKLQELIQLWWAQAGQYGALPLENRNALEILTTDRPQLTKPRSRYVYYPGIGRGARVRRAEHQEPFVHGRVQVTIDSQDAHGVLFAHGSRFAVTLSTSRTQAQVRLQLRRRPRGDRRVHRAAAGRPHGVVGLLRSARVTPCRRGHPDLHAAIRRSGRAGSGPSPVSSPSPEKGSTSARTLASR